MIVYYKNKKDSKHFLAGVNKIRNIDCLVIGEYADISNIYEKGQNIIEIIAPGRFKLASFEILRRTHSILKDGGKIVMFVSDNNERWSVFDIPWLHEITLKKYKLKKWKSYFPLFFSPFSSMKILFNIQKKKYKKIDIENEITEFCRERNYSIDFYEII